MKRIYVNAELLKEAVDYINDNITPFGFISHLKEFLKQLLKNPLKIDIDDYLKRHGVEQRNLMDELLKRHIIEKETKIDDKSGEDKFVVTYKVPKKNFERKVRRLYNYLFENDYINESELFTEDGEGGGAIGGATGGGATSADNSGQFSQSLGQIQRRKIHITKEQYDMLKETDSSNVGDYQYDVSFSFNKGKDPSYDHKNMIENGIPKKKKGIRNKIK